MRLATITAAICFTMIGVAAATDAAAAMKKPTNIPAQGLVEALEFFSRDRGIQVIYLFDTVESVQTAGAVGEFTAEETLKQLLSGSNLSFRYLDEKTITVFAPGARSRQQSTTNAAAPRTSSATQAEQKASFWNRFRVAQVDQGEGGGSPVAERSSEGQDSGKSGVQEVVVSSTRLNRADLNTPTPLMTLDASTLREAGRTNIVASLNDMPQFRPSLAPASTGTSTLAAAWNIDLRGLGPTRTLALFDGRRLESSVVRPDASVIPSILVDRIDVVTGSASAAWGSNAVAGVVNVIIDDKLEGARFSAQLGSSDRSDAREYHLEGAIGSSFADGRGHFLLGGEFIDNDGATPRNSRENVGRWAVVSNPGAASGEAPFILAPDVGFANVSTGGLILSGVNAGSTFNPDGTLRPFDFGRISGSSSVGGEAPSFDDTAHLSAPWTRYGVMGRVSYHVTDSLKLTADILHSSVFNSFSSWLPDYSPGNITISIDNAFLPAAVRNQMVAAGQTSFTMGRLNSDFALMDMDYNRDTTQMTAAFELAMSDEWSLGGYYSHGSYEENYDFGHARLASNFALAADSVISPTTGQPVCRVTLTNPAVNCVPINLFGFGAPSQAARNYATGTSLQRISQTLDTGALTLRGTPLELWAGPLAVAVGIEGRHETLDQDPSPTDRANGFGFFNNPAAKGKNSTREAFAEMQLPLVKDVPLLRDLQLNAAGRISDDATGSIGSWKVGLTNKLVEGLQLRATASRDIRAPNLNELYAEPLQDRVLVTDPQTGSGYLTSYFRGGNPNLQAEASRTMTAGLTLAPPGLEGLRVSIDYFDIDIRNAISSLAPQQVINLCVQGFQSACATISRGADGLITAVSATQLNLAKLQTRGVDAVLDYAFPKFLPGTLRLRSVFTWVDKYETDNGLAKVDFAGSMGNAFSPGVPNATGNLSVFYETERFQVNVRGRYVASGSYDVTRALQNNHIPAYVYLDTGASYSLPDVLGASQLELFANINNALDKAPFGGATFAPYHDVIGRYYALGARMRF